MAEETSPFGQAFLQYMELKLQIEQLEKMEEDFRTQRLACHKLLEECGKAFAEHLKADGDVMLVDCQENILQVKRMGNKYFINRVELVKI